jgi:hypothetical protein
VCVGYGRRFITACGIFILSLLIIVFAFVFIFQWSGSIEYFNSIDCIKLVTCIDIAI